MNGESADVRHARAVIAAIGEARERMAHYGVTEESFTSDEDVEMRSIADSLLMCVLRVTEEAGKLSDAVQVRYPQVSWAGIRGMRNILAHDYGHVDREIVWDALQNDFAVLVGVCRDIIGE